MIGECCGFDWTGEQLCEATQNCESMPDQCTEENCASIVDLSCDQITALGICSGGGESEAEAESESEGV